MRRIILLAITAVFVCNIQSQTLYSNVVTLDSTQTKSVLFSNALSWFALTFKSANDVIQMKDAETGKIIGKGIFEMTDNGGKSLPRNITITISIKDSKYKYDFLLYKPIKEFKISMDATCFNCGTTKATVLYKDNTIDINNIWVGKGNRIYLEYGNEDVPWIDKGNYKKWIAAVDMELPILKSKLLDNLTKLDSIQNNVDVNKMDQLAQSLLKEMSKPDF